MATKGHRLNEIKRFVNSIEKVSRDLYELIIICQDELGYLDEFYNDYSYLPINIYYSKPGLSHARNVGLHKAKGEILAFPDDDCVYTEHLIEDVVSFFMDNERADILSINCFDLTNSYKLPYVSIKRSGYLKKRDIFYGISSISIFHRKDNEIFFDEKFGLGSECYSSEEFDYVIRLMQNRATLFFSDKYRVLHPDYKSVSYYKIKQKTKVNSIGHGCFLRKNFKLLGIFVPFELIVVRPLFGFIFYLITFRYKRAIYSKISLISRVKGFMRYRMN